MLFQLSYSRDRVGREDPDLGTESGGSWIRTNVGESRRVYSPLPLAARASPQGVLMMVTERVAELATGLEPTTC